MPWGIVLSIQLLATVVTGMNKRVDFTFNVSLPSFFFQQPYILL